MELGRGVTSKIMKPLEAILRSLDLGGGGIKAFEEAVAWSEPYLESLFVC